MKDLHRLVANPREGDHLIFDRSNWKTPQPAAPPVSRNQPPVKVLQEDDGEID